MTRAEQRVLRLLVLVPYVLQHPGTTVDELVAAFGGTARDLMRDLNTLMMTGTPPYSPGDLVEVDIDDDGRVWVSMADHFARPLRLSRREALALYLRGTEALGAAGLEEGAALATALGKLEGALHEELSGVAQRTSQPTSDRDGIGPVGLLRSAVAERKRVSIEYYTQSRDVVTQRTICPEHVFWDTGAWYSVAWDDQAEAERTFRIDRISQAHLTDETFTRRGLAGPGRDVMPSGGDVSVLLRLEPSARWVCEYFGTKVKREDEDGSAVVELTTSSLAWVVKLVLRLGSGATVVGPPELERAVREEALATLARYA